MHIVVTASHPKHELCVIPPSGPSPAWCRGSLLNRTQGSLGLQLAVLSHGSYIQFHQLSVLKPHRCIISPLWGRKSNVGLTGLTTRAVFFLEALGENHLLPFSGF